MPKYIPLASIIPSSSLKDNPRVIWFPVLDNHSTSFNSNYGQESEAEIWQNVKSKAKRYQHGNSLMLLTLAHYLTSRGWKRDSFAHSILWCDNLSLSWLSFIIVLGQVNWICRQYSSGSIFAGWRRLHKSRGICLWFNGHSADDDDSTLERVTNTDCLTCKLWGTSGALLRSIRGV